MNRTLLIAWIVVAAAVVGAIVDVVVQPVHWQRTLAVAAAIAVVAAGFAAVWSRRTAL
jgi:hypothetical protein